MTLAHKSPIIKEIVFNLIREVHYEKFKKTKTFSIDTSIIPKVKVRNIKKQKTKKEIPVILSQNTNINEKELAGFRESIIHASEILPKIKEENIEKKVFLENNREPKVILKPSNQEGKNQNNLNLILKPAQKQDIFFQKQKIVNLQQKKQIVPINLLREPPLYGKISSLIHDKRVSMIECDGPEKPLKVVIDNAKMNTNISLLKEEIKMLLENIAVKTRVPLIPRGIYRVSWDDFIINAVIADEIEPSFIIKRIENEQQNN